MKLAQLIEHFLITVFAAAFADDALRCIKIARLHHRFEYVILAHPHIGRIFHTPFFQFERGAVEDIVAYIFLIGQHFMHRAARPLAFKVGKNTSLVKDSGDPAFLHALPRKRLIHPPHRFDLFGRAWDQDNPVSLQALMLPAFQLGLLLAMFIDQHTPKTIPAGPPWR